LFCYQLISVNLLSLSNGESRKRKLLYLADFMEYLADFEKVWFLLELKKENVNIFEDIELRIKNLKIKQK